MADLKTLEKYHPESDNITNYLEQVELFFIASDVPEAKLYLVLLGV